MLHLLSSDSPRSSRSVRLRALPAVLSLAAAASACGSEDSTPDEPRDTEVSFASLSGDIVTDNDNPATLSLAVVAPPDDPVWSGIYEFHLVNDHPDGGDQVFVGDSVQVEKSDEVNGNQLGTILVDVPEDQGTFELSTVRLTVDEGGTLADHTIGDVTVHNTSEESSSETSLVHTNGDSYPGVMSSCSDIEFEVGGADTPNSGTASDITDVITEAPGMRIEDVDIDQGDDTTAIRFTLDCDDDYDLFAFSPRLVVEDDSADDNTRQEAYPWIQVGHIDISEEDIERIAETRD